MPELHSPRIKLISSVLLGFLLLFVVLGGLSTGSFSFTFGEVIQALLGREVSHGDIILQLRLPRVLLALLAGATLSLGGFFMQALIKNPLADPYIMGVTAGAGFGVNLAILGFVPLAAFSVFTLPMFASLGAVSSLLLVLVLGFRSFFEDNAKLLIAGVAVGSLFTALTGVLIYAFADSDQLRQVIFWTFGGVHRASWPAVGMGAGLLVLGWAFAFINARKMDVLLLGDLDARSLGLRVSAFKVVLLLITSLVVGGVVAFTGPIGFVGMMIPHASRAIWGASHVHSMLPGSILGGTFLCACDILCQWVLPPAGLPLGIMTALLGVPFFLYVLFSSNSYL